MMPSSNQIIFILPYQIMGKKNFKKPAFILLAYSFYKFSWKQKNKPTVKLVELREMVKLTALIKEKTWVTFTSTWKPLLDNVQKTERNEKLFGGFDD